MAEEKKQEMLDPIAYREDFPKEYITDYDPMADLTPEYLENMDYGKEIGGANQSFSQYWDDSSPDYQNKSKWWLNDKYSWEWVKNDQVNYDANLMLKDLNPNFVYWLASKVYGTDHPWYITQRNDQIASALYNEWKTSKDDVAYFLWQQKWWMNSSEADRANTIEAVYKRLWAIAEQNPKEEEKPDLSKADNLVQDTSGKIYWKTTADEWKPSKWIDTLADANSVFTSMQESRAANVKSFISMNPADIAELMISGTSPFSEQTLRDVQQLYPEFMAQVNAEKKKKIWQQNVNAIMNWWEMVTDTNWQSNINNEIANFWATNTNWTKSSTEITKDVHNAMAQSQTANEASETMAGIEEDMAILKNRMKNLRKEANAAFKWDVPDYLVNAYINNKAQEIQNQMSILEDRYNAAYDRYKTELSNKQREMEFGLKKEQLQLQKDAAALDDWATRQWIAIDWYKAKNWNTNNTTTWLSGDELPMTFLSREDVELWVDWLIDMLNKWQLGNAQCAAWIQKYYLPLLWVDFWTLSKFSEKLAIRNEWASYTPQKWDIIILSSPTHPDNWHMGIVTGVKDNWDIEYLDWNGSLDENWNWTEKAWLRTIKAWNSRIQWYYNATKWKWWTGGTEWESAYYDPAYAEIYWKYLQWKFAPWKQLETQASAMWKTVQQLDAEARAWQSAQKNDNEATSRIDAIEEILGSTLSRRQRQTATSDTWAWSIDRFFSWWAWDFAAQYKFIKDNITFDKLLELKRWGATFWALSDQELKAIWNAASALNTSMTTAEFEKQLTWIYNELLRGMWVDKYNYTTAEIKEIYNNRKWNTTTSTMSDEDKLALIWTWNVWWWIDFWNVVQNWR